MSNAEKIDFVIIWVDGNDPEWQAQKAKYSPQKNQDGSAGRYRDWNNLKYWFRGVEKYAPWVNNVYFITCGQVPDWLNLDHPKLKFVKHEDFIPGDCLPTFSSRAIDLNFHRISELSEHFVYFNDDMFLLDHVKPEDFFVNGLPCDMFCEYPLSFSGKTYVFSHTMVNNLTMIGKHFKRQEVKKRLRSKMLAPAYGTFFFYNLIMYCLPFPNNIGVLSHHCPLPTLKSSYEELWKEEPEILNDTIHNRFRTITDVNQFVFRYWSLFQGKFVPKNILKMGKMYQASRESCKRICRVIEKQEKKMICINDDCEASDFENVRDEIIRSFEILLPDKSGFEK